jgi:biotin carboxyl carrier protein
MKFIVKVDGQAYDVLIDNIIERPIKTIVNGEVFEVWPESHQPSTSLATVSISHKEINQVRGIDSLQQSAPPTEPTSLSISETAPNNLLQIVRAPIPGVITAILVQPGSDITMGQELCKLEAMKMNNSIRASRAGRISAIHVSVDQNVKHNDVLMEFAR